MPCAVRVEVCADPEDDPGAAVRIRRRGDEGGQETRPLLDVLTEGEDLFELVDDEDDVAFAVGDQLTGGEAEVARLLAELGEQPAGGEPERGAELDGALLQ